MSDEFSRFDLDKDGSLTAEESLIALDMLELELREEKAQAQKNMTWASLVSMIIVTFILLLPIVPDSRVNAMSDLIGLFFIAQASVIGFYFGASAYMSRSKY